MHPKLIRYPVYPIPHLLDKAAIKFGYSGIGFCTVCGNFVNFVRCGINLRETCFCSKCKSNNRQRQLAYVVCRITKPITKFKKRVALRDFSLLEDMSIYNTEAAGPIHKALVKMKNYVCSEYFGPGQKSGELINGILHQDLMKLSFDDNHFDLVLSSDVLEHVPDPYKAHEEIYRVLKPGGRHVFTVPFYQTEFLDEKRTILDSEGKSIHLKEPAYHADPLRPDGIPVYTVFSLEMLVNLRRIGFRTNLYHLYKPWYGIIGPNAIVFEAIKL